jgi:prephenate dehydrogenase
VLVEQLAAAIGSGDSGRAGHFIGRGFRDMTRIAAGSEEVWSEICLLNADNITGAIDDFIERLGSVRSLIAEVREKPGELNDYLAVIRNLREGLS